MMKKLIQKFSIISSSIFTLILLFCACSSDDDYDDPATLPNLVEARTFTVNTPKGWKLLEDVGYDTQVGRIIGNSDTIYYDQGYMSFGSLDNIKETDQTLSFQKLSINGIPAIIRKDKLDGKPHDVVIVVFIDAGDQKRLNQLFTYDPKDEDLVIRIFKSHTFK